MIELSPSLFGGELYEGLGFNRRIFEVPTFGVHTQNHDNDCYIIIPLLIIFITQPRQYNTQEECSSFPKNPVYLNMFGTPTLRVGNSFGQKGSRAGQLIKDPSAKCLELFS